MSDDGPSTLRDLRWPRATARLSLRPLADDDVDDVWAYRCVSSVNRWTGRSPRSRDELVATFFAGDALDSGIAVVLDGVVVGDLMLKVQDAWSQAEVAEQARNAQALIGWTLATDRQGAGLMTEAVAELLRICFARTDGGGLGVHRVVAECFVGNEPSWRLMERLGMRREAHHVADSLHRDLGWADTYVYALLGEEWRRASDHG